MCTNSFYVYNKYARKRLLVSCGRCPACIQEKANRRAERIRNHSSKDNVCFFVTLTYSNDCVPYIKKSDLKDFENNVDVNSSLLIYRDFDFRASKFGGFYRHRCYGPISEIDSSFLNQYIYRDFVTDGFGYLPSLTKKRDCVGVIYYKDVQNFMKRLRINLKRKYNYEFPITYFSSSEYGGSLKRPHFHLLVFCRKDSWQYVKSAIINSWPYGDMLRTDKRIQFSKDASSYVASYVNGSAGLPKVLKIHSIRQKHSMSKDFGCGLSVFSLNSILEKVKQRDMSYSKRFLVNGVPLLVNMPIPKYVINRYFPRFLGDSRIDDNSLRLVLRIPELLRFHNYDWDRWLDDCFGGEPVNRGYYLPDDIHKISVRLQNCFNKYHLGTGRNIYDYCIDYVEVWNCYRSYILRKSYEMEIGFEDFYENISDFLEGNIRADTLDFRVPFQTDPNKRLDIVANSRHLEEVYFKKDKTRKVNGFVLETVYDDF